MADAALMSAESIMADAKALRLVGFFTGAARFYDVF